MTTARAHKINLESTPYYHCVARCVRRSYLCGQDAVTGNNYNHRKAWLVNRFKFLAKVFAIDICAYAVMSNHYHLVLHVDLNQSLAWSKDEVKERWAQLFPRDANLFDEASPDAAAQKIIEWRERLASISWFMRCLNENIAKLSNKEDEVSGRFWEGRFKSQALLDEGALLSAMVYVDLNPIRAGIAKTPEDSEFTSIYERIKAISETLKNKGKNNHPEDIKKALDKAIQPQNLMPLQNKHTLLKSIPSLDITLSDYFELIDCTGRMLKEGKGAIPSTVSPILERLKIKTTAWLEMVSNIEKSFAHAVGQLHHLLNFGPNTRERALRGSALASRCYINTLA